MRSERTYSAFALVERDGPAWIGYVPEFDVISEADTAEGAIAAIHEAVGLVLEDCLSSGENPHKDSPDDAIWHRLAEVLELGRPMSRVELATHSEVTAFALPLAWRFESVADVVPMVPGGRRPVLRATHSPRGFTADDRVACV